MKLVRNNGKKINHVVVPKELEPFVEYMFRRGYSEITIAVIVSDLKYIMKHKLTEKELELMSGKMARRLRYAWRHYKKFQKLNDGAGLLPAVNGEGSHRELPTPPSRDGFTGSVGVIGHGQRHPLKEE